MPIKNPFYRVHLRCGGLHSVPVLASTLVDLWFFHLPLPVYGMSYEGIFYISHVGPAHL